MHFPRRFSKEFGIELPINMRRGDVARLFGVSVRTVSRWTAAGLLNDSKCEPAPTGTVRYHLDDVEEFSRNSRGNSA